MTSQTNYTKCRNCGEKVQCLQGHEITEITIDESFNDYCYSCNTCITLGNASPLGSIIHHCSNPFTNGSMDSITGQELKQMLLEIKGNG